MNRKQFDAFLEEVYMRLEDPHANGMAEEIISGWDTCFDGDDGDDIDAQEIVTRMKNVIDELHRELRRYQSAIEHVMEDGEWSCHVLPARSG